MPQQSGPIQLAQAEHPAPAGETHAAQGAGGHHQYELGDIPSAGLLFSNALMVAALLIFLGWLFRRKMDAVPGKVQNFGEFIVESMVNFTRGIIGPGGEKYVPLVGTLFFFIFVGNLWGLIPGFHAPTANVSTTFALGLIVFLYVQYTGIRSNGLKGYLKHFAGPIPWLSPLIFPLEIVSELARPLTLAMRLFGNIFGEDTVIIVLATLGATMLPAIPIPLHIFILPLALLTAFVQAMVFSLLTCIYLSLVSHHDSEHEAHGHSPGHGHPGIEQVGMVP